MTYAIKNPGNFARRWFTAAIVASAAALSGCASQMTVNVTRFHQWPTNTQGASYVIEPASLNLQPGQLAPANLQTQVLSVDKSVTATPVQSVVLPELEFKTYAGYVDRNLQAHGLVPASRPEQARMLVSMEVQSRRGMVQERVATYFPMMWFGFGSRGLNWSLGAPIMFDPWDDYWGTRTVMRPVQSYRLHMRVADRGQTTKSQLIAPTVFDANAEYTGKPIELAVVMPYLVRAVFDEFPGVNGKTRQLRFDSKTGEKLQQSKSP